MSQSGKQQKLLQRSIVAAICGDADVDALDQDALDQDALDQDALDELLDELDI
jgi:hypothetical protein